MPTISRCTRLHWPSRYETLRNHALEGAAKENLRKHFYPQNDSNQRLT